MLLTPSKTSKTKRRVPFLVRYFQTAIMITLLIAMLSESLRHGGVLQEVKLDALITSFSEKISETLSPHRVTQGTF